MAGLVLVAFVLYVGKPILLPLALAVLLAFLLAPLCEWLEHRRVPRVVSTVLVVGLAGLVLAGLGLAVYGALMQISGSLESYQVRFVSKARQLPFNNNGGEGNQIDRAIETAERVGEALSEGTDEEMEEPATLPSEEDGVLAEALTDLQEILRDQRNEQAEPPGADPDDPLYVQEVPPDQSPLEQAGYVLAYIAPPIALAGLVTVFVLFILLQRDDLRDRVIKLAAGGKINLATQALDDAARRISRYLRAQCIVNGTYGLTIGLGLLGLSYGFTGEWFPGVILWAVLCFALRFIPYLGPWLAAIFPLLVSLGHYDGYTMFLAVGAFFVVVELLSNNVMEPMLYGQSVGMSEFAIIIAATVWTFLWGPIGLLVATPLTTCLVVLGKYVPALGFFNTLLGDEPVLSPHSRLYQRLLAMDADDAADVVEEYRAEHSLTETFDDLLLPTLALSEKDREAGNLSGERSAFIRTTMHDLVEELGDQEEPLPSDSVDLNTPQPLPGQQTPRDVRVVLLPASDDADQTAATMLKTLLDRRGFTVTVVNEDQLASEKLAAVFEERADVVLISALPPRAVGRARYLVKRLGACGVGGSDELAVLVGLWTVQADPEKLRSRVCGRAAPNSPASRVRVITDLESAAEAVRQRAEVVTARKNQTEPAGNSSVGA